MSSIGSSGRVLLNAVGLGRVDVSVTPAAGSTLSEMLVRPMPRGISAWTSSRHVYPHAFASVIHIFAREPGDHDLGGSRRLRVSRRHAAHVRHTGQGPPGRCRTGRSRVGPERHDVRTATTDAGGVFAFPGLASGSYTVTPSRSGTTFTPASRAVPLLDADSEGVDFTAASVTYAITGQTFTPPEWPFRDSRRAFRARLGPAKHRCVRPLHVRGRRQRRLHGHPGQQGRLHVQARRPFRHGLGGGHHGDRFHGSPPTLKGRVTAGGAGLPGVTIAMMDQSGTRLLLSADHRCDGLVCF